MSAAGAAIRRVVPVHESFPSSFEQALREGWTIVSERTVLSKDEKQRRGVVILGIEGRSERLSVSYTGSTGASFEFGAPRPIK